MTIEGSYDRRGGLRRRRLLGNDAECEVCGFANVDALQRDRRARIICYECASSRDGRSTIERHHPIGHVLDETIDIPGNLHRILSVKQSAWPLAVRTNRNRDPLAIVAGACLTLRDVASTAPATEGTAIRSCLDWFAKHAHRFASWLVLLSQTLTEIFGDAWWREIGMPELFTEGSNGANGIA